MLPAEHMAERVAAIQKVIEEAKILAAPALNAPPEQRNADDQFFLRALEALEDLRSYLVSNPGAVVVVIMSVRRGPRPELIGLRPG